MIIYKNLTQEVKDNIYDFLNNSEDIIVKDYGYFENEGCFLGDTEIDAFNNLDNYLQELAIKGEY